MLETQAQARTAEKNRRQRISLYLQDYDNTSEDL